MDADGITGKSWGVLYLAMEKDRIEGARAVARDGYGLEGITAVERIPQGKINRTFRVLAAGRAYKLQRLHPVFGSGEEVVNNVDAVCACLAGAGLPTSRVVSAPDGRLWVEAGGVWRMMTWLAGRTAEKSAGTVAEAARFLGLFHRALEAGRPGVNPLPPADYNREGYAGEEEWAALIASHEGSEKIRAARSALDLGRKLTRRLPNIKPVSRAIVHGDPKLDNFLFSPDKRVCGLIDLDTVRRGGVVWELADALRSWSGVKTAEGAIGLDRAIFLAAVRSYRETGLDLSPKEWRILPAATCALALDLAKRYLADYFEESYWVWDRARYGSLAEQNLSMGWDMLGLARDLSRASDELARLMERILV